MAMTGSAFETWPIVPSVMVPYCRISEIYSKSAWGLRTCPKFAEGTLAWDKFATDEPELWSVEVPLRLLKRLMNPVPERGDLSGKDDLRTNTLTGRLNAPYLRSRMPLCLELEQDRVLSHDVDDGRSSSSWLLFQSYWWDERGYFVENDGDRWECWCEQLRALMLTSVLSSTLLTCASLIGHRRSHTYTPLLINVE